MDTIPPLDFMEALKDSPRFRKLLSEHDCYFTKLETKISEILRLVTALVEFGQNYVATFAQVTNAMSDMSNELFVSDPFTHGIFGKMADAYGEIVNLQKVLIEQAHWSIYKNLNEFTNCELGDYRKARHHFDQLSSNLDELLNRKSAISKGKIAELSEARNSLTAVGTCFAHNSLDLVAKINEIQANKNHELIEAFWSFLRVFRTYFNQGHGFFAGWLPLKNETITQSTEILKGKSKQVGKKMQDRHILVPKEIFQHPTGMSPDPEVIMEGYLFKRATNAFKTWNRRWFEIRDHRLLYSHRNVGDSKTVVIMEPNLKICLVRPPAQNSVERSCCFELVTPTKNHMLQADSESLCSAWMRALQRTIQSLHESEDDSSDSINKTTFSDENSAADESPNLQTQNRSTASMLDEMRRIDGNEVCADCRLPNPKWVSINLGVTLCIECCGIHRSLGVQISKIRSLTMDSFDNEQRRLLLALGNSKVNRVYLAYLPKKNVIPQMATQNSTRAIRETWIKSKYLEKRFSRPSKERTKTAALNRCENLNRHRSNIVELDGLNRSNSLQNLTIDEESPQIRQLNGVETKKSSPPPISTTEVKWKSSPALNRSDNQTISSCGSDTNLVESAAVFNADESVPQLWQIIDTGKLEELCILVAQGLDINWRNTKTTLLHKAVEEGQTEIVEYLLLNGAKINVLDHQLNSPLHIAAAKGHILQVIQLLKRRGIEKELKNKNGQTALDLAVASTRVNIVTLLRLQLMRDEFSEEFNNPMDETVEEILNTMAINAQSNQD